MAIKLEGTQTVTNLTKAFTEECIARNLYTFYANVAYRAGDYLIQKEFLKTADNERAHGKAFYMYLESGLDSATSTVTLTVPVGLGNVTNNLLYAAKDENVAATAYREYAKIADEEGFPEIATSFSHIADIETHHEQRFLNLLKRHNNKLIYRMPYEVVWQCSNCGFFHRGVSAPELCPSCSYPQRFFMIFCRDIFELDT